MLLPKAPPMPGMIAGAIPECEPQKPKLARAAPPLNFAPMGFHPG
jgi:hypothetical protein